MTFLHGFPAFLTLCLIVGALVAFDSPLVRVACLVGLAVLWLVTPTGRRN